jgi:hypothetical protein
LQLRQSRTVGDFLCPLDTKIALGGLWAVVVS